MATMGLFDRDRTTRISLLSSGLGTTEIRTFYALRAGTYYLIFHPSDLSYGDYVIQATPLPNPILNDPEPNDSLELARPVGLAERSFGHIGYSWQSNPTLGFERPNDRLNALRYLVWFSDTLNPPRWQPLLASETVIALEGNRETVRFVDPTAFDSQPTRFYRLSVELKP